MLKKFIFIILISCFCTFIGINSVYATSYVGWQHIEVDSLPIASSDTMNFIYDYDDKYYVTTSSDGSSSNIISLNDNLRNVTINIFEENFIVPPIFSNNTFDLVQFNNSVGSQPRIYGDFTNQITKVYFDDDPNNISNSNILFTGDLSTRSNSRALTTFTFPDYDLVITEIKPQFNLFNMYIEKVINSSFEWVEISVSDFYEIPTTENTDMYFFYNFTDISSFNVFSWVDFTSFTDFQKLVIVIGINSFFLGLISLCIYIIIKSINKLISMLF